MNKNNIDRLALLMSIGCSIWAILSFEMDLKSNKENPKLQATEQLSLEEINQRLIKIEQHLSKLMPGEL